MKRILIILGNGFTIDFLQKYSQWKKSDINIDVRNLFKYGEGVITPWDERPGFLSYKHCPNLWMLGARPNLTCAESNALIEEIISCANMFFDFVMDDEKRLKRIKMISASDTNIHLKAYKELIMYLGCLFNAYNNYITDEDIKDFVNESNEWGWLKVFKDLKNHTEVYLDVITFNYDIWLERVLKACEIKYTIGAFDKSEAKVRIYKPHGSISFFKKDSNEEQFRVNYQLNIEGIGIEQLTVSEEIDKKNCSSIIIPPAGEAERLKQIAPWASIIESEAIKSIRQMDQNKNNLVIMCGLSYWHVDRREIDQLLVNIDEETEFILINPSPPRDLNAVLSSIFKNYVLQTSADNLGGIFYG